MFDQFDQLDQFDQFGPFLACLGQAALIPCARILAS